MNTNSTDLSRACQAERPEYLSVRHNGQEFRLKREAVNKSIGSICATCPRLRDT